MPDHDLPDPLAPGRRRVLVALVNGFTAIVGGALTALLGVFALRPASAASDGRWVRAAALDDLDEGVPLPRVVVVPRVDGWYRERAPQTVFLVRDGGGQVRALSATCTHLGCQVRWVADQKHFHCPCHGGVYDASGAVLDGPPPRPLDHLEARVDTADGSVLVRV
jgi:quinol---cytochrome c reductase iron-sulfur subunit, bacillus type